MEDYFNEYYDDEINEQIKRGFLEHFISFANELNSVLSDLKIKTIKY